VVDGRRGGTLECEEKNALGEYCLGRESRVGTERVEVCLVAQLQHILARSGRRRTASLRRLSMLVALVVGVLFR
jgi:hypothetical protein